MLSYYLFPIAPNQGGYKAHYTRGRREWVTGLVTGLLGFCSTRDLYFDPFLTLTLTLTLAPALTPSLPQTLHLQHVIHLAPALNLLLVVLHDGATITRPKHMMLPNVSSYSGKPHPEPSILMSKPVTLSQPLPLPGVERLKFLS